MLSRLNPSKFFTRFSKRTLWIASLVLIVLLAGGGYAYYKYVYLASQATTAQATLQTTTVRRGDLVIYASGTGTLIASDEVSLAFKTGGQITAINVKVGDQVKAGDVLAQVDDADAQVAYKQAKRNLLELTSVAAVASAQQAVAQAQLDLQDAISHLQYIISPRVYYWEQQIEKDEQVVKDAQAAADADPSNAEAKAKLKKAQDVLAYAQDSLKSAQDSYENYYVPKYFTTTTLNPTTHKYEKAVYPPSAAIILEARAGVTEAKATLQEAQYYYDALTGGDVPDDATGSNLTTLENAKLSLEAAQNNLDGTRIVSPISGTVMSIDTRAGDTVSASTSVITVADLSQPYLEVFLDESDWSNVQIGYPVDVTFDILPDKTFRGKVVSVDPGLYTESNSSVVRAYVTLDQAGGSFNLPLGTSAAVDVIGGEAKSAVLVPVEAIHEAGEKYMVFVRQNNGKLKLQVVQVGIKDSLYAEIKSGLKAGDVVSTGITETK